MEKENKSLYLLKNIALFILANFIPKAITFFMIPLYTYCLSTTEYGIVDLLNTTIQLMIPIFTIEIQDAILRFSMDRETNVCDVFTIGMRIVFGGIVLIIVLSVILKVCKIISFNWIYIFFLVFIYSASAIKTIMSYFCRGIDKINTVTMNSIVFTLITVICNLAFLLLFNWGIYGYLSSLCIGNIFSIAILFFDAKLYKYFKLKINNKTLFKEIILFSIPMVLTAISWWINNSLDRYILNFYYDVSAVGLLGVAYKIPSILSLFGISITYAYSISVIKNFDKNDTDGFLGNSYSVIGMCFTIGCSFIMCFNILITKNLFLNDFFTAWKWSPPLLVAALFDQLGLTCNQYFISLKKTNIISITTAIGAIINFIANIILIPKYSGYGAAISTAISFFLVWLIRYCVLQKYLKLKHNFLTECVSYVLVFIQMYLAYFGNNFILYQLIIFIFIIVMYRNTIFVSILNVYSYFCKRAKKI